MATTKELMTNIGKYADLHPRLCGLYIRVQILDVKQAYGRIRYLVTPVVGSGEQWYLDNSILNIGDTQ